jgi:hypothetical protein
MSSITVNKVNKKLTARLLIDFAMTGLLLCALAYRLTGDTAHEWVGIAMFAVCIAHNTLNWKWYKNIFKGAYNLRRTVMTAVNILILLIMTALVITGLLQSRTILAFLHLPGGMIIRQIHTTAAYWGLILIAVHIGFHWGMIMNIMRNITRINRASRKRTWVLRITAVLIVFLGVLPSFDRDMFSKLFLGFSFDYWPEERPAVLFFAAVLSIMGIYIFVTYYAFRHRGIWRSPPTHWSRNC